LQITGLKFLLDIFQRLILFYFLYISIMKRNCPDTGAAVWTAGMMSNYCSRYSRINKHFRPFAASRYRSLSFSMSWNWNIFTGTNMFKHAEFKSEKFPRRRPAVFSQTAILSSLISQQVFFIVQRHGSITIHDYITQNDQFLLTSLPFNKIPFCSNHFELCNLMRVGRKQHILSTTLRRYRQRLLKSSVLAISL
jgi:hypothetical protein